MRSRLHERPNANASTVNNTRSPGQEKQVRRVRGAPQAEPPPNIQGFRNKQGRRKQGQNRTMRWVSARPWGFCETKPNCLSRSHPYLNFHAGTKARTPCTSGGEARRSPGKSRPSAHRQAEAGARGLAPNESHAIEQLDPPAQVWWRVFLPEPPPPPASLWEPKCSHGPNALVRVRESGMCINDQGHGGGGPRALGGRGRAIT
jgi:hypothetical protein